MFKIESYVTPILLSYVDKYVKDFKPADAQVSLWGGGVVLHNLVLKADVLQQEVSLPFTLVSGRIHELLIQVPWTKIMSEPIVVKIDTIECVLSLRPPSTEEIPDSESQSRKNQVVEAPPGYMQALVRRIVSNIALRVHHLILKYVDDDIVLSLNVKHLSIDSAGQNWKAAFADIHPRNPVLRRLVQLDDLTLCLDRTDSDGKIRYYQEPLLYRCQLQFRVLTHLMSSTTRRARSLDLQLLSSKLAFSVTSEQLTLLIRLLRNQHFKDASTSQTLPTAASTTAMPLHAATSNSAADMSRTESWSDWAWSWMPAWSDRATGTEEITPPTTPIPINFAAYLDSISLVLKIMEQEQSGRKRARGILELKAEYAAVKCSLCVPTLVYLSTGARRFTLQSMGKCSCGHVDMHAMNHEPAMYLTSAATDDTDYETWTWPDEDTANEDNFDVSDSPKDDIEEAVLSNIGMHESSDTVQEQQPAEENLEETSFKEDEFVKPDFQGFWKKVRPIAYFEYNHERTAPLYCANPYENPPTDFEYSDWAEECSIDIRVEPIEIRVCMGLIHRLSVIRDVLKEVPSPVLKEKQMRVLTVEECDALSDNLPQCRISFELERLRVQVSPWDHSMVERTSQPPLVLYLDLPKTTVFVIMPMYPHRVCSAACQLLAEEGPIWRGARLHCTATLGMLQLSVATPSRCEVQLMRPVARVDLRVVTHHLLHRDVFVKRDPVHFSYTLKFSEINVCGSSARLQAATQILKSLIEDKYSAKLRYTSLPQDALHDQEAVALDITAEEINIRGYITNNINTHVFVLQSAKATVLHAPAKQDMKQAWLFSGPDVPTTTPYLRFAVQWCKESRPDSLDYAGVWSEPTAMCLDPLFIAWLAYEPQLKPPPDVVPLTIPRTMSSTTYLLRRRNTPPQSNGRGQSRSSSSAELVHSTRPRSASSQERSDVKMSRRSKPTVLESGPKWTLDSLIHLHDRLRRLLLTAELGLILVYITPSTASAIDCATVRDALEMHAAAMHKVVAISLGRISVHTSSIQKQLWYEVRHDGPTIKSTKDVKVIDEDSFPWKMRIADVSCYTLEVRLAPERSTREKSSHALRSQLKVPCLTTPRTILELLTTTVTLSVVTKTVPVKCTRDRDENRKQDASGSQGNVKYFSTGINFKPTTLKEFIRGPTSRRKSLEPEAKKEPERKQTDSTGPVVSIGVCVHADTPPILLRLDQDQVYMMTMAIHCFSHLLMLLRRPPLNIPQNEYGRPVGTNYPFVRSVSELDEFHTPSTDTTSENQSEKLIPIFEPRSKGLTTSFWFQWVVSRMTLVTATSVIKFAFNIEDMISTIDLQPHYNQYKIKVSAASIKHYEKTSVDDWTSAVLGGRVLEAREPANPSEESHFLTVTITQALIANLPASWKEEMHPKMLEKSNVDSMWEIYATLAPLEAVLRPSVLNNALTLLYELSPKSYCPLQNTANTSTSRNSWHWPFCFVSAGGLRLLVTTESPNLQGDDTIMIVIGKISVNPHPENPIIRRTLQPGAEGGWLTVGGGFEGRQYDVIIKNVGVQTSEFIQLINQEASESRILEGSENPAAKWAQPPPISPVITTVLHALEIGCVLAPALHVGGSLASGPALEVNLMTDCYVDVTASQLRLCTDILLELNQVINNSEHHLNHDHDYEYEETGGICPYAVLLMSHEDANERSNDDYSQTENESSHKHSLNTDSDIENTTVFTNSTNKSALGSGILKKSVSIACVEEIAEPFEHLELYITVGVVRLTLYTIDDNSQPMVVLRPPPYRAGNPAEVQPTEPRQSEATRARTQDRGTDDQDRSPSRSKTSTEDKSNRSAKPRKLSQTVPTPSLKEGILHLITVILHQPNVYYWKKKIDKSLQISLFNAWIGLGVGPSDNAWHAPLLHTTRGQPDPITDIPPALFTMKLSLPTASAAASGNVAISKGKLRLDVDRPVMLEISMDSIQRLKAIVELVKTNDHCYSENLTTIRKPVLYKIRKFMAVHGVESVTVQTGQMGARGFLGSVGWESCSIQMATNLRSERLVTRVLFTALLLSAGSPDVGRHPIVHPLVLGIDFEATWEAWRRAEGGSAIREPTIRLLFDLDKVVVELKPEDVCSMNQLMDSIDLVYVPKQRNTSVDSEISDSVSNWQFTHAKFDGKQPSLKFNDRHSSTDHYYKDDLRSGAFKIVKGGHLPMAYQIMLCGDSVSWRYPHPRAIARFVAYPLPNQNTEVPCVLEHYCPLLECWEVHTHFNLPVGEPREIALSVMLPDTVFALIWRFRACVGDEKPNFGYEFDSRRFMPRGEPMTVGGQQTYQSRVSVDSTITAEELSGVLRVDSYFAPHLQPRARVASRVARFELHLHNSLPDNLANEKLILDGYYVSQPMIRSHRILSLIASNTTVRAQFGSPFGKLLMVQTIFSSDIIESSTGTMEEFVEETQVQAAVSLLGEQESPRIRLCGTSLKISLHLARLRTLQLLAETWKDQLQQNNEDSLDVDERIRLDKTKHQLANEVADGLDGLISIWIHNCCAASLRLGQEDTDEVVTLAPDARLAYRWKCPSGSKRLRFSLASSGSECHWSNSISLQDDESRVRIRNVDLDSVSALAGVYLYTRIVDQDARLTLIVNGRLVIANMLRKKMLYKVRARSMDSTTWRTMASGEIGAESFGRNVICSSDCDLILKIKFAQQDVGWSGDIPLKECPKENVPWLVKVPSAGNVPYISVWCRVLRARKDGRILATIWPLYVIHSHLTLDTDVLITTESGLPIVTVADKLVEIPPLVQTALGRGATTHLLPPGTTSARHSLSLQYRDIESPVTREAIPMHYGVTDTSVFEKHIVTNNIEEVIQEIVKWLERAGCGRTTDWPYSCVTRHRPGPWVPAMLQPRADVTVRYSAVRVGGGCCLELQLRPSVLLCNAVPFALTLRAHDAAPLCKIESGAVIAAPSVVMQKSFFMSIEIGRETFVSDELEIWRSETGPYADPPDGRIVLDRPSDFAIQCNNKVALLTLFYEIKEDINLLGVSSTYRLLNNLGTKILVSAVVVPNDISKDITMTQSKFFKVLEPDKIDSCGKSICKFWLRGRWRGSNVKSLRAYLYVAMADASGLAYGHDPVPVRLAEAPVRKAISLRNCHNKSVPVVVTQQHCNGRWLVTISSDPCPQFYIYNGTGATLAVGEPLNTSQEPITSRTTVLDECVGVRWQWQLDPEERIHYSTPSYNARYPATSTSALRDCDRLPFLTFSYSTEEYDYIWSPPVAIAPGEQFIQLSGGTTLKLKVVAHPHSTLIELRDVNQNDISASDIRHRLVTVSSHNIQLPFVFERPYLVNQPMNRGQTVTIVNKGGPYIHLKLISLSSDSYQKYDYLLDHKPKKTVFGEIEPQRTEADENVLEQMNTPVNTMGNTNLPPDREVSFIVKDDKATLNSKFNVNNDGDPLCNSDLPESDIPQADLPESDVSKIDVPGRKMSTKIQPSLNLSSSLLIADVSNPSYQTPASITTQDTWCESMTMTTERARCVLAGLVISLAANRESEPLLVAHFERPALLLEGSSTGTTTILSVAEIQIDNRQYESGQYDFAVVASTRWLAREPERWPPPTSMFGDQGMLSPHEHRAHAVLQARHDAWTVDGAQFNELTELELKLGPLALYIEDAYVTALVALARRVAPIHRNDIPDVETRTLVSPLRLRILHIHPLDLTLTLHTAVRMYIALDQSPLRLGAFRLCNLITSTDRLTHALTVHYLSAAILAAGWVVGGLELLGAPGALAARVGGATGGVRGVASAAAAAVLRSVSAWAGSLARNLDLLAGDDEHSRRAAAARRRPPPNLLAGLLFGLTNLAVNMLGAVGGLAHHPLVGAAVGESGGAAAGLRRGLVGAVTKPLSATADLLAFAGHGLLQQTGWEPLPQPRPWNVIDDGRSPSNWQRDCVRWAFRLADMTAIAGFRVLLDNAPLLLLLTHKYMVVADPDSERIVEMIELRNCTVASYHGPIIEITIRQRRNIDPRAAEEENEYYRINAAAMARVARYTGIQAAVPGVQQDDTRRVLLLPAPGHAYALHALLATLTHSNSDSHFLLM